MRGPISPTLTIAALALGAAGPASAQSADGEWQTKAEAVLVAVAIDEGDPIAPAGDVLLGSAMVEVARSDTFENGLTLGWLGAARFERDASWRGAPCCMGAGMATGAALRASSCTVLSQAVAPALWAATLPPACSKRGLMKCLSSRGASNCVPSPVTA